MSKHAYLIIAHNEFEVLQTLLTAIDDSRNDIYVHIDRKVTQVPHLTCHNAQLHLLEERIDARWGDYSLVETELRLFERAVSNGRYDYYHLISGVDLPIKSQDYIHQYCTEHLGTEFIGFASATEAELRWRTQHYFLFSRRFQDSNWLVRAIRKTAIKLQDLVGYQRHQLEIKKGCQWCSLTHGFVEYLLTNRQFIYNTFHHTYCPDELFVQTLCWNSPYREKVHTLQDEFEGCKRYIKWVDGELRPITMEDMSAIKKTSRWFARKFTREDSPTIQALLQHHES